MNITFAILEWWKIYFFLIICIFGCKEIGHEKKWLDKSGAWSCLLYVPWLPWLLTVMEGDTVSLPFVADGDWGRGKWTNLIGEEGMLLLLGLGEVEGWGSVVLVL
jgi:hypothetical protein